jgi:hypothetical protein
VRAGGFRVRADPTPSPRRSTPTGSWARPCAIKSVTVHVHTCAQTRGRARTGKTRRLVGGGVLLRWRVVVVDNLALLRVRSADGPRCLLARLVVRIVAPRIRPRPLLRLLVLQGNDVIVASFAAKQMRQPGRVLDSICLRYRTAKRNKRQPEALLTAKDVGRDGAPSSSCLSCSSSSWGWGSASSRCSSLCTGPSTCIWVWAYVHQTHRGCWVGG